MKTTRESGFSLVELMIVFSIISTLITIGLAHYKGFKNSAYDSEAEGYVRHSIKLIRALNIDEDISSLNFELAKNTIVSDTMSFINQLPKLREDPKGMYIYINKSGVDLSIVTFHCHGNYKYTYDSSAGEFVIQKAELTSADLTTKCTSAT